MFQLISIELYKIFRKWRTYIGFIAIGVLVPLIHLSFYLAQQSGSNFAPRNITENFVFSGNILNGYFIGYIVLQSLFVHIPFLIVLVGGDLLAGEATSGTYRMLITRPVSRFQIVTSKFLAGIVTTILLLLWLAVTSLGLGVLFFGTGVLFVFKGQIIVLSQNDVLWRFFAAYGFGVLSMTVVVSLAFLFSSLVENAIGPIVATMAVLIVFMIISVIQVDIFTSIKPYLFTNYMAGWLSFFDDPIDKQALIKDSLVLGGHVLGFYLITLFIFLRKDILS
ncbi:MAG: ABC transporter permease subunit [Ignavibacteriales bacterium]|nr:ABC transporter permease subunit [Ignavibacteriales bacterium]